MVPNSEIVRDGPTTKGLNLLVLQRIDPFIEDILVAAPHVILYQLDSDNAAQWIQQDVAGSLFVVKRKAAPRFQFIVMNGCNPENLVEDIVEILACEVKWQFLMYQNKDKEVRGIWFNESQTLNEVCNVLNRILSAYTKTSAKLKLPPTTSELEEPEEANTSDIIDRSQVSSDENLLNLFSIEGTPDGTTPRVEQPKPHQELHEPSLPTIHPSLSPSPPPNDSAFLCNHLKNLVKPTDFVYRPPESSKFAPPVSSSPSLCSIPRIVPSCTMSTQYGAPLLAPRPPPNPPHFLIPKPNSSQVGNSTNAPTVSKEKVREALTRLAMNDYFVEIVYQEILKAHYL